MATVIAFFGICLLLALAALVYNRRRGNQAAYEIGCFWLSLISGGLLPRRR